ncbi:MAG: hypothetical protein ACREBS_05615 [Nitrososphaerales archaeon]
MRVSTTISPKLARIQTVNPPDTGKIQRLTFAQLILYLAVWLFGIYINGFEPSPSETVGSPASFFLNPAVIIHFVLAAATASVGIMLFSLGWVYGLRKFTVLTGLSLASIAIAATGGLSFVFGMGNQGTDSMLMATSFITALYLTFLAILSTGLPEMPRKSGIQSLSFMVLGLFYLVFLSGIYVNLFVASSVFSEPPAVTTQMLGQMVTSPPVLLHETSGVLLLGLAIALTATLFRARFRELAIRGALCSLLIVYSLLEGVLMNVLPIFEPPTSPALSSQTNHFYIVTSVVAPLFSAAGFLAAILIAMSIAQRLWILPHPTLRVRREESS